MKCERLLNQLLMPKFPSIEKGKPRQQYNSLPLARKNSVQIHYNPEAATLEYFQQHIAGAVGNMWANMRKI